jgi:peroxiredoxin
MNNKFAFIFSAAIFLICACGFRPATPGYSVGDTVKDFSLMNVDGKKMSLATNKEVKGYIITFTCNTCPFSLKYENRIIELHKKYADKGYPVLAINPNDPIKVPGDSFEKMQERAKDKNFGFPYLVDDTQEVAKAFGATNTPHIFIVKKYGNDFKVEYIGAIDDNAGDASQASKKYAENALDELLAGKDVTVKSAKAIGCTIKWKSA